MHESFSLGKPDHRCHQGKARQKIESLRDHAHKRADGGTSLLTRYQCLIVDEAHKLLSAARQIYGVELPRGFISDITADISALRFEHEPDKWIAEVFKACEAAPQHRIMSRE